MHLMFRQRRQRTESVITQSITSCSVRPATARTDRSNSSEVEVVISDTISRCIRPRRDRRRSIRCSGRSRRREPRHLRSTRSPSAAAGLEVGWVRFAKTSTTSRPRSSSPHCAWWTRHSPAPKRLLPFSARHRLESAPERSPQTASSSSRHGPGGHAMSAGQSR